MWEWKRTIESVPFHQNIKWLVFCLCVKMVERAPAHTQYIIYVHNYMKSISCFRDPLVYLLHCLQLAIWISSSNYYLLLLYKRILTLEYTKKAAKCVFYSQNVYGFLWYIFFLYFLFLFIIGLMNFLCDACDVKWIQFQHHHHHQ